MTGKEENNERKLKEDALVLPAILGMPDDDKKKEVSILDGPVLKRKITAGSC